MCLQQEIYLLHISNYKANETVENFSLKQYLLKIIKLKILIICYIALSRE